MTLLIGYLDNVQLASCNLVVRSSCWKAPLVLLPCTAVAFFDLLNHPLHCIGGSGHGYHSKTTNKGSHTIPCFHSHASRH